MIGYHYTSFENWRKIKKTGLKRKAVSGEAEFSEYCKKTIGKKKGTFVWIDELSERAEREFVIMMMNKFRIDCVIKVAVRFNKKDTIGSRGARFWHSFKCSDSSEEDDWAFAAYFITKNVPPKNLEPISIISFNKINI